MHMHRLDILCACVCCVCECVCVLLRVCGCVCVMLMGRLGILCVRVYCVRAYDAHTGRHVRRHERPS